MRNFHGKLGRAVTYLLIASALSFACGGDGDDDDPATPATVVNVGQDGGLVGSPTGANIYVPPGALDSPTALTISVSTDAPELPGELAALGDVYALTPHGQEFNTPVDIRIPFEGGTNPALYTAPDGGSWSLVEGASEVNGAMSASVVHFSFFVVVEAKRAGGGGTGNSGGTTAVGDGGEGGGGSTQAGAGNDGGGASLGGSDSGGAPAQAGAGNDGGNSPSGGAGGAGGSGPVVCSDLCGHNQQACCAFDGVGTLNPETCGVVGGVCLEVATYCDVDGFCAPQAGD